MEARICRHALDRVPIALIIDDSTVLVNLNYLQPKKSGRFLRQYYCWGVHSTHVTRRNVSSYAPAHCC